MYGKPIAGSSNKKLFTSIKKGDTEITLDNTEGLEIGDELMISPTEGGYEDFDEVTIKSITDKKVKLNQPIKFFHYGATKETLKQNDLVLDMRARVSKMNRSIEITTYDDENKEWGCRLLVSQYTQWDSGKKF